MIDTEKWLKTQQEIRDSGSPEINLKLDQFHKRYCSQSKHCWVPGARKKLTALWEKEKAAKVMAPASGTRYIESN